MIYLGKRNKIFYLISFHHITLSVLLHRNFLIFLALAIVIFKACPLKCHVWFTRRL